MNEDNGNKLEDRDEPIASGNEDSKMQTSKSRRTALVAIVAVVAIAAIAVLAWLLWPSKTGEPVPAPRSVSFGESSSPPPATTVDQVFTLAPHHPHPPALKIATVR